MNRPQAILSWRPNAPIAYTGYHTPRLSHNHFYCLWRFRSMMLTTLRRPSTRSATSRVPRLTCSRSLGCTRGRRSAFTLLEVLVVVAILVILATVATVATTRYIEEARKTKAQLGCVTIDKAIKAYMTSTSNPGLTDDEKLPNAPEDLIRPFGSASSFLEGGQNDLTDPWGKRYDFERRNREDGTPYIVVKTKAPDGTPISQYGVGPNSEPRFQ